MKIYVKNCNGTLRVCLNILRWVGFLLPDKLSGWKEVVYPFYAFFWYTFIVGIYVITQTGALIQVWGNVSEMTETSFLLFTSLAFTIKIINSILRRRAVQNIIDEGENELRTESREEGMKIVKDSNKETTMLLSWYSLFASVAVFGWAFSAEKNQLPLRAWYPYDLSEFPAYHLTYLHQSVAVVLLGVTNVSLDQLVTSLIAVCCCRMQLLKLSLRTLCEGISITDMLLTPEEEEIVKERLHRCVLQHQAVLNSAAQIQQCFTIPILAQFTVSTVIICVTAYQSAEETTDNSIRQISMWAYLMGLTMQVYLYCYQANNLSIESSQISDAAYECPWYACSIPLRRSLLLIMVRTRQMSVITAGGFTTLSLDCFVSIIKASYSFYTVLQGAGRN